ncbi:hypothetical protein CYMTET_54521 [Cymbomonas tetramitiformis]|uniref:Uncharacterized protein n=1 Tax=Cymbomonas tetramitiformis TaxID=36881 RepID=A0AAE0BER0_9CHLO|nr:hypothetical protein CYMTET_54521 [Cymbomonas tetramitiformis]
MSSKQAGEVTPTAGAVPEGARPQQQGGESDEPQAGVVTPTVGTALAGERGGQDDSKPEKMSLLLPGQVGEARAQHESKSDEQQAEVFHKERAPHNGEASQMSIKLESSKRSASPTNSGEASQMSQQAGEVQKEREPNSGEASQMSDKPER